MTKIFLVAAMLLSICVVASLGDFEDSCMCGRDQLQVDSHSVRMWTELKDQQKNTDVAMFYAFICPRVYVGFILDMIIVFNK